MKSNLLDKTTLPVMLFSFVMLILLFSTKHITFIENTKDLESALFGLFFLIPIIFLAIAFNHKATLFNIVLTKKDIKSKYHRELFINELKLSKTSKIKLYSFFKEYCIVTLNKGKLEISYCSHHNLDINNDNDICFITEEINSMLEMRYKPSHV